MRSGITGPSLLGMEAIGPRPHVRSVIGGTPPGSMMSNRGIRRRKILNRSCAAVVIRDSILLDGILKKPLSTAC